MSDSISKRIIRKRTAVISKSSRNTDHNNESDRSDRHSKPGKSTRSKGQTKPEKDQRNSKRSNNKTESLTRNDSSMSTKSVYDDQNDQDLFLKLQKDREKAGASLYSDEKIKRYVDTKTLPTNLEDVKLYLDQYFGQRHRPTPPSLIDSAPPTPSVLVLSDWEESDDDEKSAGGEHAQKTSDSSNDTWQNDKTLAECNLHIFNNKIDCDVTVLVGDVYDTFNLHSFILRHRSPEFTKLLDKHISEKGDSKPLILREISKDVFEQIIKYIYTDHADITSKLAWEIIPATAITGPRALRGKCLRHLLCEDVSSDNVCILLEHAHKYEDEPVYKTCLKFINVNGSDVLHTDNFCDLCKECLDDVTKSDDLNADEYTVFDALVRWADKRCEAKNLQRSASNKRKALGRLVFNARFATLKADGFSERVANTEILDAREIKQIQDIFQGETHDLPHYYNLHPRRKYHLNNQTQQQVREIPQETAEDDGPGEKHEKPHNDEINSSAEDMLSSDEEMNIPIFDTSPDSIGRQSYVESLPGNMSSCSKVSDEFPKAPHKSKKKQTTLDSESDDIPKVPYSSKKKQTTPDAELPRTRVVRFQSLGGSWEMGNADVISFKVSSPIVFRGVQIFGPENEVNTYRVDIRLYDEIWNKIRGEEVYIEPTPDNIIKDVALTKPARLPANQFFTIQMNIWSKPTFSGSDGVTENTVNGVTFEFKDGDAFSPKTNVRKGQIPCILYSKIEV